MQAQRPPWLQERYSAFGRVRAFLETQLEQTDFHGNDTIECKWQPDFVIISSPEGEETTREVGHIDGEGAVHLEDSWSQDVLGCSALDLKSRLRVCKSRRRQ